MVDHQGIESQHRETMTALAHYMDDAFKGYGFALLVFPFADNQGYMNGRMNYISNAQRADMLVAMKEFIAHNEGRTAKAPKLPQ